MIHAWQNTRDKLPEAMTDVDADGASDGVEVLGCLTGPNGLSGISVSGGGVGISAGGGVIGACFAGCLAAVTVLSFSIVWVMTGKARADSVAGQTSSSPELLRLSGATALTFSALRLLTPCLAPSVRSRTD